MGQEILSANMRGLPMEYGDRWRQWRKGQHACLNAKMSLSYREFQTLESTILLRDLLHDNDHLAHFRRFATSIAFCISYGTRIKNANEKIVIDNQEAAMGVFRSFPDHPLHIQWPFLLWLPKSLQWFRWEQEKRRIIDGQLYTGCLREVKRKVAEGVAKPSMSLKLLEESSSSGLSEMEMAYAAAGPFSAGIPTMLSSLEVFLLAMVLHPECVRKAQEELDHVVGQLRMPTFEDEPSLPYVHALIKETMRWRVITPTAVAHATIAEDVYDEYTILAGTTVYANVFVISKDPDMFPEPERFRPERFIETSDPRLLDFELPYGFGRRVCPGRFVANETLFIAIARTLWAFQISPVADSKGKPVLPDPDAFTSGLARRPLPFECVLRPRNGDISKIILADAAHADVALQEWA
ncbi:cytochrome P450 [Amylostereum chailletii]|nr:cytochrome P450 [Amylostereum chailletii]